jgi:ABC-type glycerol-3-phosphate transport system substrate-binding protein
MNHAHGMHWFWANGADLVDDKGVVRISEPAAIETLQHGLEYYRQQITPTAAELAGTTADRLFTSGRVAMVDYSLSRVPIYTAAKPLFEWGAMPTSNGRTGKPVSTQYVDFWYVHGQSRQPEPAYQAIEVMNGEDFEVAMAKNQTGGIPSLKSVAQRYIKDLFQISSPPEVILNSVELAREPYHGVNGSPFGNVLNKYLNGLWAGQYSVREAAESIAREIQPIVEADKA